MGNFRGNNGGMQNMMKQAQKIQEQMQKAEAELDEMEVLGFSGGAEEGDETLKRSLTASSSAVRFPKWSTFPTRTTLKCSKTL